jgi:hypothetical protein
LLAFIRPVLATRSGAAPLIGIYSPGVARGLHLALVFSYLLDIGNTLGGYTYAVNLNGLQRCQLHSVYYVDLGSRYSTSMLAPDCSVLFTMTQSETSVEQSDGIPTEFIIISVYSAPRLQCLGVKSAYKVQGRVLHQEKRLDLCRK